MSNFAFIVSHVSEMLHDTIDPTRKVGKTSKKLDYQKNEGIGANCCFGSDKNKKWGEGSFQSNTHMP